MIRIFKFYPPFTRHCGQTYLEYVLIVTVALGVIVALTPMIKRVLQGMVMVVSDQVGLQQNSDQSADQRGALLQSLITQRSSTSKSEVDYGNYVYNDNTRQDIRQVSDLGFTESQ